MSFAAESAGTSSLGSVADWEANSSTESDNRTIIAAPSDMRRHLCAQPRFSMATPPLTHVCTRRAPELCSHSISERRKCNVRICSGMITVCQLLGGSSCRSISKDGDGEHGPKGVESYRGLISPSRNATIRVRASALVKGPVSGILSTTRKRSTRSMESVGQLARAETSTRSGTNGCPVASRYDGS